MSDRATVAVNGKVASTESTIAASPRVDPLSVRVQIGAVSTTNDGHIVGSNERSYQYIVVF
jgi:hypothetical protein